MALLRAQSRDAVVVGHFNPHIITPPWLRVVGICEAENVDVELGINVDDRQATFHFTIGDFRWQVSDTRLLIGAQHGNPSIMVARVLDKLPHTPIKAIGHNFVYRTDSWEGMRLPQIGDLDASCLADEHNLEVSQSSWATRMQLVNATFNIKVVKLTNAVEVTTNIHREASNPEQVAEISEGFERDLDLSKRMVSSILGVDVV